MVNKTSRRRGFKTLAPNRVESVADQNFRKSMSSAHAQTGKIEHAVTRAIGSSRGADMRVRHEFGRHDYEFYRQGERVPTGDHEVIRDCILAYKEIGIVRNAIDTYAEFGCQDGNLVHENEKTQRAYRAWWKKIRAQDISEKFLRHFFREGIAVPYRTSAKIPLRLSRQLEQAWGAKIEFEDKEKVSKREIPISYTFLNPLRLDVIEPELAVMSGGRNIRYSMRLSSGVLRKLRGKQSSAVKSCLESFPADIRSKILKGENRVELDHNNVLSFRYKPDDWSCWGNPMLESILIDCNLLRKMKLTDATALDGAMSCVRVWKLGSLDHRLAPADGQMDRLAELLQNTVGGGVLDIIWTADIDLLETKTDLYQFLGEEKYKSPLTQIHTGIGIPPSMTGASSSGGLANNFIAIKTLTKRLQYAREVLTEFWEGEIRRFQKAMGFKTPAQLTFAFPDLTDQGAENQLLLHLVDRDLISLETVSERLGLTPEVEKRRLQRERRMRKSGKLPHKASPFHTAQPDHELTKIALTTKAASPSQVGLKLNPHDPKDDRLEPQDSKKGNGVNNQPKGEPGQGRPPGSKDKQKRSQKRIAAPVQASLAQMITWSMAEQRRISGFVVPAYLKSLGKQSTEELSPAEQKKSDAFVLRVLASLQPGESVTQEYLRTVIANKSLPETPAPIKGLTRSLCDSHVPHHQTPLDAKSIRAYQAIAVATYATAG